jgi:hypothetical protein
VNVTAWPRAVFIDALDPCAAVHVLLERLETSAVWLLEAMTICVVERVVAAESVCVPCRTATALRMTRPMAELAADSAFRKLLVAATDPAFELAAENVLVTRLVTCATFGEDAMRVARTLRTIAAAAEEAALLGTCACLANDVADPLAAESGLLVTLIRAGMLGLDAESGAFAVLANVATFALSDARVACARLSTEAMFGELAVNATRRALIVATVAAALFAAENVRVVVLITVTTFGDTPMRVAFTVRVMRPAEVEAAARVMAVRIVNTAADPLAATSVRNRTLKVASKPMFGLAAARVVDVDRARDAALPPAAARVTRASLIA